MYYDEMVLLKTEHEFGDVNVLFWEPVWMTDSGFPRCFVMGHRNGDMAGVQSQSDARIPSFIALKQMFSDKQTPLYIFWLNSYRTQFTWFLFMLRAL